MSTAAASRPRVGAPTTPDPELELLLCVSRGALSPQQRQQLRELLDGPLDWARLRSMAAWHRLTPLLYRHLQAEAAAVPDDVLQSLRAFYLGNTHRMLALTGELLTVIRALDEQGIPCLPYKGPALAAEAYGNVSLRCAGDLDVVVHRRDLPRVRALLRSRGYVPEHQLPGAGEALMERVLYHERFYHADGYAVEVHWAFSDKNHGFALDLAALEPRLGTITLGREEVLAFSREDLLLVLCVHGAKHRWDRLEWLVGVAELLRASSPPAWPVLLDRADELRCRRMLFLGLRLANELFDAPLPLEVRRRVVGEEGIEPLVDAVRSLLYSWPPDEANERMPPHDVFYLRLNDRVRDRLRFLMHRLTTPSQAKSWRGLTMMERVYLPLHVIARPFQAWRTLLPTLRWYLSSDRW